MSWHEPLHLATRASRAGLSGWSGSCWLRGVSILALSDKHPATDYGSRLGGKPVGLLADRSLQADFDTTSASSLLSPYLQTALDPGALGACVQCGACTATCGLMERGILVPRRQTTLLGQGLHQALIEDVGIWHCRACNDCTTACPAGAGSGRVLAAARQMAVERFAPSGQLARELASFRGTLRVTGVAAVLLLLLVALEWRGPDPQPCFAGSEFRPLDGGMKLKA